MIENLLRRFMYWVIVRLGVWNQFEIDAMEEHR